MDSMLKIDLHVHSKGVSLCSHVSCEEIIDQKLSLGYQGAVLCNHCQAWYYPKAEHASYIERVIEEYRRGKVYAERKDFAWYLGLEVTLDVPRYADWLLYGVTEEFLRRSPCLYTLTQKELFALCEEYGVLLVQAHPFREGQAPCEPQYMHGVEINCSAGDLRKAELVKAYAKEHGLFYTCGTDYHFPQNTFRGGVYLPKSCQTSVDIANYMRKVGQLEIFMEE